MSSDRTKPHLEIASSEELAILEKRLAAIVAAHKKQHTPQSIVIEGKQFTVCPNVFDPTKGHASLLLLPFLQHLEGKSVLDIGCGIGTYTIFAAFGGAKNVIGVDNNPYAIACSQDNIASNKVSSIASVRQGDMFAPLGSNEQFDVILTNPPFFRHPQHLAPKGYIEQCFIDAEGVFLHNFLAGAKDHVKQGGCIYMLYGKSGMVDTLIRLLEEYHYQYRVLSTKESTPDKYYVLKLTVQT